MSDDFPAFGKPTSPASAMVFSSSSSSRLSPGSPRSANPGALRFADASAAFPSPPRPPLAATNCVPAPTRSASTSPSGVLTTVPSGTPMSRSAPSAPLRFEPAPALPLPARRSGLRWKSRSVATLRSTVKMTSPPRPPFPPSGPPSGLNFSRCIDAQPLPPLPAWIRSSAWSANSDTPALLVAVRADPIAHEALAGLRGHLFSVRGDYADSAPTAPAAELDATRHEGEERVVSSAADTDARVEVRAALAHEYLARVD